MEIYNFADLLNLRDLLRWIFLAARGLFVESWLCCVLLYLWVMYCACIEGGVRYAPPRQWCSVSCLVSRACLVTRSFFNGTNTESDTDLKFFLLHSLPCWLCLLWYRIPPRFQFTARSIEVTGLKLGNKWSYMFKMEFKKRTSCFWCGKIGFLQSLRQHCNNIPVNICQHESVILQCSYSYVQQHFPAVKYYSTVQYLIYKITCIFTAFLHT